MIQPQWSRIWNKSCISIGDNVSIGKRASLLITVRYNNQYYQPNLSIGDKFCAGNDLFIACIDEIIIGDNVLFSDRVFITDHIHGYSDITLPILTQDLQKRGKIHIGSWSFIWINAVILPGVTIGKNAVIWASSVVTSDVPDYAVATGNPARVIKQYDVIKQEWMKVSN